MPSPPSSPDSSLVQPSDGQADSVNVDKSDSGAPHPSSTSVGAFASRFFAQFDAFVAQLGGSAANPALAKAINKTKVYAQLEFMDAEDEENEAEAGGYAL